MSYLKKSNVFKVSESSRAEQKEESSRMVKFYECFGKPINGCGLILCGVGVEVNDVDLVLGDNNKLIVLDKKEFTLNKYLDLEYINEIFKQAFSNFPKLSIKDKNKFDSILTLTYPLCKYLVRQLSREVDDALELKVLEEPFNLFNKIFTEKDFNMYDNNKYIYNILCNVISIYIATINELKPLVKDINPSINIDEFLIAPFSHIINLVKISN